MQFYRCIKTSKSLKEQKQGGIRRHNQLITIDINQIWQHKYGITKHKPFLYGHMTLISLQGACDLHLVPVQRISEKLWRPLRSLPVQNTHSPGRTRHPTEEIKDGEESVGTMEYYWRGQKENWWDFKCFSHLLKGVIRPLKINNVFWTDEPQGVCLFHMF